MVVQGHRPVLIASPLGHTHTAADNEEDGGNRTNDDSNDGANLLRAGKTVSHVTHSDTYSHTLRHVQSHTPTRTRMHRVYSVTETPIDAAAEVILS